MKVNRDMVARAGLKLLNEVGLEQLTLRLLAKELNIQAPTVYWHFKSKEELIDEMATMVLAKTTPNIIPVRKQTGFVRQCFDTGMEPAWSRVRGSQTGNT
jgi:AcrR family transcriptional regulator